MANIDDTAELLRQVREGNAQAAGALFARHQDRLRRMIELRLDRRLHGRLHPSDVLQEAFLEFSRSLAAYLRDPAMPFYLWLRMVSGRKLQALHRRHLGVQARDAGREVSLYQGALPQASSVSLAAHLLGHFTTPSQAAVRAELQIRVQEALNGMDAIDREILSLRHFEQLGNLEISQVLGISEAAASNRFVRALRRLKKILLDDSGLDGAGLDDADGKSAHGSQP
jgi:RNA polymerase sigma-70 factor (ECF subfamily)